MNALNANNKKTTPPTIVTVRTEIRCAIIRPPITAKPVQIAWPRTPPTITPYALSRAASTIVDNWDRSPHSATNVIVKAWTRMRTIRYQVLFGLVFFTGDVVVLMSTFGSSIIVITPLSTSGKSVVETASFSNWKEHTHKVISNGWVPLQCDRLTGSYLIFSLLQVGLDLFELLLGICCWHIVSVTYHFQPEYCK